MTESNQPKIDQANQSNEQGKHMENLNPKEARSSLFSHLDFAIALSRDKASKEKAKNTERMSWTRILIQGVEAYGKLLESVQLEEIEARIKELERLK